MAEREVSLYGVTIINCRTVEGSPTHDMVGRVEKRPCANKWHKIVSIRGITFLRPYNSPNFAEADQA